MSFLMVPHLYTLYAEVLSFKNSTAYWRRLEIEKSLWWLKDQMHYLNTILWREKM